MNPPTAHAPPVISRSTESSRLDRLDYLDATRAFALLLGIVFHASMSFMPIFIGWAVQDVSTSGLVSMLVGVSHSFRMELFFLIAGFFGRLTFHRKGVSEFIRARCLRILVPFLVGWFLLRPLIVSGWIMGSASLRGDYSFWSGIWGGFQSLASLPAGLWTGTHLWFLYYLAMITSLTLAVRGLIAWTSGSSYEAIVRRGDALVAWLANSRFALAALVLLTAGALWFMRFWGMDTPDQSLLPNLPVLLVYGGFFVFGWMLERQRDLISPLTRLTPTRGILAGVSIAAVIALSAFERDLGHPHRAAAHVAFVIAYATAMWLLVFLTIGIFRRILPTPRPAVRYLADSSYWLYLIHLPIVVWLQVAVAELALHWSLKLALITALTLAISLLSYDLFVRPTFIGAALNGRRGDRVIFPWILGRRGAR